MDKIKSFIGFEDYNISNMIFRLNPIFDNEREIDLNPNFSVSHNFYKDELNNDLVEVLITCEIFDEDFKGNKQPFYLNTTIRGYFTIELNNQRLDSETVKNTLYANTVAILFPYLRSIVTTITATVNISPLILPPVNTYKLLENQVSHKTNKETN